MTRKLRIAPIVPAATTLSPRDPKAIVFLFRGGGVNARGTIGAIRSFRVIRVPPLNLDASRIGTWMPVALEPGCQPYGLT
jgi:hypothetical protein